MKLTLVGGTSYGPAVFPPTEVARHVEPCVFARGLLPRLLPIRVHEVADVDVRLVSEAGIARGLVVAVTGPSAENPVYRAFRALRAIGIQIAHARVRLERGAMVQVLQLTEANEGSLAPYRVPQVLAVLRDACGLPASSSARR